MPADPSCVDHIDSSGVGSFMQGLQYARSNDLCFSLVGVREPALHQCVRPQAIVEEMMNGGVRAIPAVAVLAFANGAMVAMQGVHTLRGFGAESRVAAGIALSSV